MWPEAMAVLVVLAWKKIVILIFIFIFRRVLGVFVLGCCLDGWFSSSVTNMFREQGN